MVSLLFLCLSCRAIARNYDTCSVHRTTEDKFLAWLVFEHALLVLKVAVHIIIPDEPASLSIIKARQRSARNNVVDALSVIKNGIEQIADRDQSFYRVVSGQP